MLAIPQPQNIRHKVTADDIVKVEFTRRFGYVYFRSWASLNLEEILDYSRSDIMGNEHVLSSYAYIKHHRNPECDEICLQRAWTLEHIVPIMEEAGREDDITVTEERRVVTIHSVFQREFLESKKQPEAMSEIVPALKRFERYGGGCGTLCLPCGYGKTTMACAISCALGMKTLFVVMSTNGRKQFIKEAEASMTNCKVGYIQTDHLPDPDCTHVVALLQTLLSRGKQYFEEAAKLYEFGLVIVDECHRLPASQFSTIMGMCGGWTRLGLTATPQRGDGEPIQFLLDSLGSIQYHCYRKKVPVKLVILQTVYHGEYPTRYFQGRHRLDRVSMISSLTDNAVFLDDFSTLLCEIIQTHPEKRILILCDRVSMCDSILHHVNSKCSEISTFFVMSEAERATRRREENKERGVKRKRRSRAEKEEELREFEAIESTASILTASVQLCSTEYNNPTLNMVINLSWTKQPTTTVQSTGRGLRMANAGIDPVFMDIEWVNCRPAADALEKVRIPVYTAPIDSGGFDIPESRILTTCITNVSEILDFIG